MSTRIQFPSSIRSVKSGSQNQRWGWCAITRNRQQTAMRVSADFYNERIFSSPELWHERNTSSRRRAYQNVRPLRPCMSYLGRNAYTSEPTINYPLATAGNDSTLPTSLFTRHPGGERSPESAARSGLRRTP